MPFAQKSTRMFYLQIAVLLCLTIGNARCAAADETSTKMTKTPKGTKRMKKLFPSYEIWAADQSNSASDVDSIGDYGSFLWIWDSDAVRDQLSNSAEALPLSCTPNDINGPCDLLDIFPSSLIKCYENELSCTNDTRADMPHFGRLHAVNKDPQSLYVTANIFSPKGGYIGIIDATTKEAVGLFRVTAVDAGTPLSVHISYWTDDGSAILVANLHGKMIERINVSRDANGKITDLEFDKSASVFFGKGFAVKDPAAFFHGKNAFGRDLLGSMTGSYDDADTSDLTPAGVCKESDCQGSTVDMLGGKRPNNVPICPVTTHRGHAYVTFGGGGLFVLDVTTTPMKIIAEYGNAVINGAGLCGVKVGDNVFLNKGASAGGAGFDQSTSTLYAFNDQEMTSGDYFLQNFPMPVLVFKDAGNTNTIGNANNAKEKDESGQLPGITTRRDSHGLSATIDGKYVHMTDRIQNVMDVFDAVTFEHVNTYDLVSMDGKSGKQGPSGPCFKKSVLDDGSLPLNDPTPDLFDITPDGKYFVIAFRGPVPVTVPHAAQGSCPGVGIVEITEGGKAGRLVDVLRTTNTVDNVGFTSGRMRGGHDYTGTERSDPHYSIVVAK